MQPPNRPFAGLHIPSAEGVTLERFMRCTKVVLSERDGGSAKASVKHGAVASTRLIVRIKVSKIPGQGAHVGFVMARREGHDTPDPETMARILADIVLRSSTLVDVSAVEWLQPSIKLAPEDFQESMRYVSSKRAVPAQEPVEMASAPAPKAAPTPKPEPENSVPEDDTDANLARLFRDVHIGDDPAANDMPLPDEPYESLGAENGQDPCPETRDGFVKRAFSRFRRR